MSAGVTFGSFALEAFTKLKKSRAAEVDNGGGKHEIICAKSDTGAAAASASAPTTPTHCLSCADIRSEFIQPNSFAGKRELSQLLRTQRERPTTACCDNRQQSIRPR